MNQDTVEKWILLEQSGELGAFRRWLLNRHLRANADARRFQSDLQRITSDARASQDIRGIERDSLAAILQAARENTSRRETFELAPERPAFSFRPALAFAALALLVGATWMVVQRPETATEVAQTPKTVPVEQAAPETALPWDDGLDQSISELGNALASASADSEYTSSSSSSDLDEMARELIAEGSQI